MRTFLGRVFRWLRLFGCDPLRLGLTLRDLGPFLRNRWRLGRLLARSSTPFCFGPSAPCLGEAGDEGGSAKGAYFHQDLLVAQRIFARKPERHLDVGSRIDGFVAHVASFRQIEVIDIRPVLTAAANISFRQADLMAPLPPDLLGCCDSLSCLHALEHFGLARYGDQLDPDGHVRGLANLDGLLQPGGRLYLSVPIGPQRIEFNAHRVFGVRHLLELVATSFAVEAFSFVDDPGNLHVNVPLLKDDIDRNFGCRTGCGILELIKRG